MAARTSRPGEKSRDPSGDRRTDFALTGGWALPARSEGRHDRFDARQRGGNLQGRSRSGPGFRPVIGIDAGHTRDGDAYGNGHAAGARNTLYFTAGLTSHLAPSDNPFHGVFGALRVADARPTRR